MAVAFVAVACVLAPVPPASGTAPPVTHTVLAGNSDTGIFAHTRFYPDLLRVHRGDTVTWLESGLHTVTFSTAEHPTVFRTDDLPGWWALEERLWAPSPGCGVEGREPCVLAGDGTVNAGAGFQRFRGVVDLPPRAEPYAYRCLLHPEMRGALQVVPDAEPVPTPAEVSLQRMADVQADRQAAEARFASMDVARSRLEDGRRVWTVHVGDSTPNGHVTMLSFLPASLEVAPGDAVEFVAEDALGDLHTVTFPAEAVSDVQFVRSCDLDDRQGGLPTLAGVGVCPVNPETLFWPQFYLPRRAPDDAVVTPVTDHDSGLMFAADGPAWVRDRPDGTGPLPDVFRAEFPADGGFAFRCRVHPAVMTGSVRVG